MIIGPPPKFHGTWDILDDSFWDGGRWNSGTRGSRPPDKTSNAKSTPWPRPASTTKRIYSDKKSGATADRPGLIDVLDRLLSGDVLVVYTLDRLGRTVRDVLNHIHQLRETRIGPRTLADAIPIDTSKPGDAMSELAVPATAASGNKSDRRSHCRPCRPTLL